MAANARDWLVTHLQASRREIALTGPDCAGSCRWNLVSAALQADVRRFVAQSIVLRYGHLYGPGTGTSSIPESPSLHVDAAASAALLAIEKERSGIYNIADQNGYLSTAKARLDLGFDPEFRLDARA